MKNRNGLIAGLMVLVSAAGFLAVYAVKALKIYNAKFFTPAAFYAGVFVINLVFAGLLVLAVYQVRKGGYSAVLSWLMILIGLGMMLLPFYPVLLFRYFGSYGTYESITGGMWVVVGLVDLIGRGKVEGA